MGYVSPGFHVVDEAATGQEAIAKTLALQPDLILVDMTLPDISGLEVIAQVRRLLPAQKVIAMNEARGSAQLSEAVGAGCHGYLMKDTLPGELALAMNTVMEGRRFISQELATELVDSLGAAASRSTADRRALSMLTIREQSVFKLIAQGGTNRSVAEQLAVSPKTVEKHRANLMRKLELRSAVELALLAVEVGVIHRTDVTNDLHGKETVD